MQCEIIFQMMIQGDRLRFDGRFGSTIAVQKNAIVAALTRRRKLSVALANGSLKKQNPSECPEMEKLIHGEEGCFCLDIRSYHFETLKALNKQYVKTGRTQMDVGMMKNVYFSILIIVILIEIFPL